MPTWKEMIENNPAHSINYANRWREIAARGDDIVGEARLIDAMAERGSKILDAGCGQGRLCGYLVSAGHDVAGTDLDPVLIDIARTNVPEARFYLGDLCVDPVPETDFDLIVSAGNVMGFLPVSGREQALRTLYDALRSSGRAVIGYGAGRGWDFQDFLTVATNSGFVVDSLFSTWTLEPFTQNSDFLVAVLRKP
jgi:hypothetical protein